MRFGFGLGIVAGVFATAWVASIDRAHWYDRYGQVLQVQHCTKDDKARAAR